MTTTARGSVWTSGVYDSCGGCHEHEARAVPRTYLQEWLLERLCEGRGDAELDVRFVRLQEHQTKCSVRPEGTMRVAMRGISWGMDGHDTERAPVRPVKRQDCTYGGDYISLRLARRVS